MTAAADIKEQRLQTIGFDERTFYPFLGDFVAELVRLVAEADTSEAKKRLIQTLNVVVERAGIRVCGFKRGHFDSWI